MSFGKRLKAFAKARYGTQGKLAEVLGVSDGSLSDWVRGAAAPDKDNMEKIAAAGVNMNWLLTGKGPMILPDDEEFTSIETNVEAVRLVMEAREQLDEVLHRLKPKRKEGDDDTKQ